MPLPALLSLKPPWRISPHQENDQECPSLKFDVHKLSKSSKGSTIQYKSNQEASPTM